MINVPFYTIPDSNYVVTIEGKMYHLKGDNNIPHEVKLRHTPNSNYLEKTIRVKGKITHVYPHRFLANVIYGNLKGIEIHHIDGNTKNNHIKNLAPLPVKKHKKLHSGESVEFYPLSWYIQDDQPSIQALMDSAI